MPINTPKGLGRRTPELEDNPEFSRDLRLAMDELNRKVDDTADQASGSKYDEIEFKSAGEGETVRIANSLDYVPNRMRKVCSKGPYEVGEPEDGLFADEDFIYVVTNAPKGTVFVVEFDQR